MCKNCDSVQVCRLNFQMMSELSLSSANGPLSGSGVSDDCGDDEACSVTSGILQLG